MPQLITKIIAKKLLSHARQFFIVKLMFIFSKKRYDNTRLIKEGFILIIY